MQAQPKSQSLTPLLKWSQKSQKIFLTIPLHNITDQQIQLTPTSISFTCTSNNSNYKFAFEFYGSISVPQCTTFKTGACLLLTLVKDGAKGYGGRWPRLNREGKLGYVLIDWDRWDEDSQGEREEGKVGKVEAKLGGDDEDKQQNEQGGFQLNSVNSNWNDDDYQDPQQKISPQADYPDNDDNYDRRDDENDNQYRNTDMDMDEGYDEKYERYQSRGDSDD